MFKNANIFDSDSDLANFVQAMTVPHGAQIVRAGSEDPLDSVTLMYNPKSVVNYQGADPLSAP